MHQDLSSFPKIIVPFQKSVEDASSQDIIIYLRPESNGIKVESALFKVLKNPQWDSTITMSYLANLPGEFIMKQRIVENHYFTQLNFAAKGRIAFTPTMKEAFSQFFGIPFEKAHICGAFEALHILHVSVEELFQLWVPAHDILEIQGQLIKRTSDNLFIVNYDIPALLHKNHRGTDVAVLVLNTTLSYQDFQPVIQKIRQTLIQEGILDPEKPERRFFHYSKGPFEQILDGLGYVYVNSSETISIKDLQFGEYLFKKGIKESDIYHLLKYPIGMVKMEKGSFQEKNLLSYTLFDTYEKAYEKYCSWDSLN